MKYLVQEGEETPVGDRSGWPRRCGEFSSTQRALAQDLVIRYAITQDLIMRYGP
jgi:hypothetical protein